MIRALLALGALAWFAGASYPSRPAPRRSVERTFVPGDIAPIRTRGTDGEIRSDPVRETAPARPPTAGGGCRLEVRIPNLPARHSDRILLVREEWSDERSAAPWVTYDDLAPGRYAVQVERAWSFELPWLLATGETTLAAGQQTAVVLELNAGPPRCVPFSGTIDVPAAWGDVEISLAAWTRESGQAPGRCRNGRWSFGRVPPGEYRVVVRPFSMEFTLDVPLQGTTSTHLTIPPPATVSLRFVGEAKDAARGTVLWSAAGSWLSEPIESGGRLPARAVSFESWDVEIVERDRIFHLRPGPNEVTLRALPATVLRVEARERGRVLSRRPGLGSDANGGHDGYVSSFLLDHPELTLTGPGRYRITFDAPRGYRPVAPRELDLPRGVTDIVVDLERE